MKALPIGLKVFALVCVATLLSVAGYHLSSAPEPKGTETASEESVNRVVGLSPTITELLYRLGVWDRVVGRTDFCEYPESVKGLPAAGTGLTPNFEVLVGLNPDMIFTEDSAAAQLSQLESIAPTVNLRWLTLEKAVESVLELGRILKVETRAKELVSEFRGTLGVEEPEKGPRVLLLLGAPSDGAELWFVKRNSLHGRAMHAAGLRNALAEDVSGAPSMSYERLVEINPEAIVVLVARDEISADERNAAIELLNRFPMLDALRDEEIHFLVGKGHFSNGPRLLDLVKALKALKIGEEQGASKP